MLLASALAAKDQIEILLREYDTLRAEIIARTTAGSQLVAVAAILFTALLTVMATRSAPSGTSERSWLSSHAGGAFWSCLSVLVAFVCVFTWLAHREINIIAERLQRIEQQVNGLAGTDLLEWETKWGAKSTGWFPRHAPKSD